jgi:GTP-binding protein Era
MRAMANPDSTPQGVNDSTFRCGFAAILGRPNAGKSTLLNALVGEKIAIVSQRPQTTRDAIRGILSGDDHQIIFVDTPGIIAPRDRLNEALMVNVREALDGIDVALHLLDATEPPALTEAESGIVRGLPCPRLIVPTKTDLVGGSDVAIWVGASDLGPHEEILPVSAVTGGGLQALIDAVKSRLPFGPPMFDPEQLTDRDLRFLAAEAIREKIFEFTGQELPYAAAVKIEEFRESAGEKAYISATICVERDSQVGMIVGQGGSMIRRIGEAARSDIELLMGTGVFLDLRVKVRKNWRRRDADLRMFGYHPPRAQAPRGRRP